MPPMSVHNAFFKEGGGDVHFEAPRARNIMPSPLSTQEIQIDPMLLKSIAIQMGAV